MLEPLVVKATRAVPRRGGRSNPPDLSNEIATSLGSPIPLKVSETREYLVLILVVLGFHSRKLLTE